MPETPHAPDETPPDPGPLEQAVGLSPDAVLVADAAGRIVLLNAAAQRMFGYTKREAAALRIESLLRPVPDPGAVVAATELRDLVEARGPVEVSARHKDGREFWAEVTLSRIARPGGALLLCIARDATERVRRRRETDLDRKRLQDAYESLQAFTYVVGHDLKEPVRGMAFCLEELEADPDTPDRADLIRRAAKAQRDLQHLLHGLLDWSRTSMTPLDPRPLLVHEVLRDPGCAAQWDNLLRERNARLDVSRAIPPVLATEPLLCRVFGNLITNAIRHNPKPNPTVRVRAAPASPAGLVQILVEDDGPGFPAAHLDKARALQGGPHTLKDGFGLAITRRALERLHGELSFANRPEGGGVVTVTLPALAPPQVNTLEQRIRELV